MIRCEPLLYYLPERGMSGMQKYCICPSFFR